MKITRSRAPANQEGATAVIVVLILFALFGMIVLVVDVGGLLYARRGMVNASDAAALAAAQSCIGIGENEEAVADQYAAANVDGVFSAGANITARENCHEGRAGYVSVEYSMDWPLFFSGVLGVQGGGRVTTAATAHWGPAGVVAPIPLVIYEGALQGACEIPSVDPGATCYIWEDNDLGLSGGNFGFLDVAEGWNVAKSARCSNAGGADQLADWISGRDGVEPLGLNYPRATWVCTRDGEGGNNPAWRALEDLIGQTKDFPIVGATPEDGEPAFFGSPRSKYNTIGFAHFEIVSVSMASKDTLTCPIDATATLPFDLMTECEASGLYIEGSAKGDKGAKLTVDADGVITAWSKMPSVVTFETTDSSDCGGNPAPNASAHCLVLEWKGATIGGGNPGGGANFGIFAPALCDLEIGSCIEPG
jgi:putative Flp pilus-assembly TadE/G-like protein